jgi:uncharacterized protein YkwD
MPKKQTKKRSTSVKSRMQRHVILALVPHKTNQYRPHAVRRYGIVVIIALVIGVQFAYNSIVGHDVLGTEAQVTSSGLLTATNQIRSQQGEQPLHINQQLTKAAELKVKSMFDDQYWAHNAPDGTTPWHWFGVVGYSYAEAGENLAKNFTTSDTVVSAWMASPTHRANILKAAYKDVGFAVMDGTLDGKPASIVVALYGLQDTGTAVQGASVSTVAPPTNGIIAPLTRLGLGVQSLTPAATGSLIVLLTAGVLALLAHAYRRKLPANLRRSWYRHHGVYKAIGFTAIAVVTVFIYGGAGQI